MFTKYAIKIQGANERERESKRFRRLVTPFFRFVFVVFLFFASFFSLSHPPVQHFLNFLPNVVVTMHIVGLHEADLSKMKVSYRSPHFLRPMLET